MTSSEYATLIFYWYAEPHPERMDEMLAFVADANRGGLQDFDGLRMAGIVLALEELDPTRAPIWRQNFPDLYRRIGLVMNSTPKEFPGWSDYLVCQWFILRQDRLIIQLLERAGQWGERCKYTAELISKTAAKHGPFRYNAERLRVIPVVQVVNPVDISAGIGPVEKERFQ